MSVARLESGKLDFNLAPVNFVALASHAIETAQVVTQYWPRRSTFTRPMYRCW